MADDNVSTTSEGEEPAFTDPFAEEWDDDKMAASQQEYARLLADAEEDFTDDLTRVGAMNEDQIAFLANADQITDETKGMDAEQGGDIPPEYAHLEGPLPDDAPLGEE